MTDPYERLQPRTGTARTGPSAARLHIREHFAGITAARARGVSWQQIAAAMAGAGVRGADGGELGWRRVKGLYHAERYSRPDGKRKRRPKPAKPKAAAAHAAPPSPAPEPPPAPPGPGPAPAKPGPDPVVAKLRAQFAKRRPDLKEPAPVVLGPGGRRPSKQTGDA